MVSTDLARSTVLAYTPVSMAKQGRKPKFSASMLRVVYRAIICGQTESSAARLARVTPDSLFRWKREGLDHINQCKLELHECVLMCEDKAGKRRFLLNLKRAESLFKGEIISNIKRIGKKEWTANAWMLERRFHDEFGKKTEVTHSGEITTNQNVRIELRNVDVAQRMSIAKAMQQRALLQQRLMINGSTSDDDTDAMQAELVTPQDTDPPVSVS